MRSIEKLYNIRQDEVGRTPTLNNKDGHSELKNKSQSPVRLLKFHLKETRSLGCPIRLSSTVMNSTKDTKDTIEENKDLSHGLQDQLSNIPNELENLRILVKESLVDPVYTRYSAPLNKLYRSLSEIKEPSNSH